MNSSRSSILRETTVSHLLRDPTAVLEGRTYGEALAWRLAPRGRLDHPLGGHQVGDGRREEAGQAHVWKPPCC